MTQVQSARRFYDRISRLYDALADSSEHKARQLGLRLLAPCDGQQVLEIGFGTGHGLVEIAERLSDTGRVWGIDISPGMRDVARKRVENSEFAERVAELGLGDATDMPFDDDSFDAVFASFTLELFSETEIPRVLAETSRVLRPGGRIGLVSMLDDGRRSAMVASYRFLHRHFPHIVDCQPIDVPSYVAQAGFDVIASEGVSIWGLPVLAIVGRLPDSRARIRHPEDSIGE